ncbi:hypothetical protein [Dolichospermum compactum]|jgi:hypothetical protein|uniref:Uncharacterized protein n=2 Tax=Dolichospermum TaxID=748770 RepID=A0A1Z4V1S4_9CYAN|nr:hypothetical protein [Dolichospermum compactum]BAZ85472.1 hypothetical protein NIES806_16750 [Dolichospermum compactum NIES-806]
MTKAESAKHFETFQNSPEMEIYKNLLALKASFRVFNGNFNELQEYLEHLKTPNEALVKYSYNKRENIEALIDESSRLFHNFLSSAKSLVDHTRVIVNRLYPADHEFNQEYQNKLQADLANHPIQKFIQNLRNYTQHYTLPIPDLQIAFGEDMKFTMQIDTKELLKWKKWGDSKPYLENLGDSFSLVDLANEYYQIIQDFYVWLTERQHNIHQQDLENLKNMQKDL